MFTYKKIENDALIDEEKIAADLNEAIEKSKQEAKADAESENEDENVFSFRPEERLACDITVRLAEMTAERLDSVLLEMEPDLAKTIARRLEKSEAETMVNMIQVIFLTNGLVCAAEDLDILRECEAFDRTIYMLFQDHLMDDDVFDCVRIEDMFENHYGQECGKLLRFPLEVRG